MFKTFFCSKKVVPALVFCACCVSPFFGSTQETALVPRVERVMPKVSFINPAVALEIGLTRKVTLATQGLLGYFFIFSSSPSEGKGSYSVLYPAVETELRYYYSQDRRQRMGKNWRANSGAFLGGATTYRFDPISERTSGNPVIKNYYKPSFSFGPVWGIQLTEIKSHFNFSCSFGPTLSYTEGGSTDFSLFGRGHLNLGFVIGKYSKG